MKSMESSCAPEINTHQARAAEGPLRRMIFVPSLFVFMMLCGTILLAYSYYLDGEIDTAGLAILGAACAVVPLVYINALKIKAAPGHSGIAANIVRAAVMAALACAVSALVCGRIRDTLADGGAALGLETWTAHVESVIEKRYYREAGIRFWKEGEGDAVRHGLARITGGPVGQGDTIRFLARPREVAAGGGMSSANRALRMNGVRHVFYLDGKSIVIVKAGSSFREGARKRLASNCDRLFNRKTSAMVKALYFGNQDYIDKITMNDYKRAGVFHILSAGGLHVGVIAAIPLFLLGIVRVNRRIIMAAAVMAVFIYLYMTDMPVCLLRSCIMFFMYAAQRIAGREVNIFNTFFLSGVAILFLFPHEIFGLGFQLSYGATLGILLFHGAYRKTLSWLPGFVSGPLALTIAAQLLILPVLLVRLNELNLAGLLSNIIVVPLMSILLVASLAAHVLSIFTEIGLWAGRAVDLIYGLCGMIVEFMSGLDGHFYVAAAGPALVAAFCLLAAPLLPGLRARRMATPAIAAAVAVAWLSLVIPGIAKDSVTVVRHGTGACMVMKRGATISVTGQIPDKAVAYDLSKIISAYSPREVDLHITDPDYRNFTGYGILVKRLPVRRCYLAGGFRVRGYTRRFFEIMERDGAELIILEGMQSADHENRAALAESAEHIRRLYGAVAAGDRLPAAVAGAKKMEIQYLTLH